MYKTRYVHYDRTAANKGQASDSSRTTRKKIERIRDNSQAPRYNKSMNPEYRRRVDTMWGKLARRPSGSPLPLTAVDWAGLEQFIRDVLGDPALTEHDALDLIADAMGAWTGRGEAKLAPHTKD